MRHTIISVTLLVVLQEAGCGSTISCGPGTVLKGDLCVPDMGGSETGAPDSGEADTDTDTDIDLSAARWSGDLHGTDALMVYGASDVTLGYTLGAGDLDGDGQADLALGNADSSVGALSGGAVYGFLGPFTADRALGDANFVLSCDVRQQNCAKDMAAPGDLDGDGTADLVIGAPQAYDDTSTDQTGYAYIVHGPIVGSADLSEVGLLWTGENANARVGYVVDAAGDVSGDGLPDVVIGASQEKSACSGCGAAYVVDGPAEASGSLRDADALIYSDNIDGGTSGQNLGASAHGLGDINGDGVGDLGVGMAAYYIEGSGYFGAIFVIPGPVDGGMFAGDASQAIIRDSATGSYFADLSHSFSGADMDGDGYSDPVLGAYADKAVGYNAGALCIFSGDGLSGMQTLSFADARLTGEAEGDLLGYQVATPGDLDGDGAADLLAQAQSASVGARYTGATYLVYGPISGSASIGDRGDARFLGDASWGLGIQPTAGADLTGDGVGDVILGAPGASVGGEYLGGAAIFPGMAP